MKSRYLAYDGITGFTKKEQIVQIMGALPPRKNRWFMAGVLASSKTITGRMNRYPERYPQSHKISGIFTEDLQVLNLVHYSTDDASPHALLEQLEQVVRLGGRYLHGIQLNMVWPSLATLKMFTRLYPRINIVLQVGGRAMSFCENDPSYIAETIRDYVPYVQYVLIDPSGGVGNKFVPEMVIPILSAISDIAPKLNLVIGGGLGPNSTEHLKPVVEMFPEISTDMESRVRTQQPEDALDIALANQALAEVRSILT